VNLFATVLTYAAPSANYRGESEQNRLVIQRVTRGRFEYAIISPEAMRNALRELLRGYGLPCNRERLHNEEQLAVRFEDFPWPQRYIDDFYFGYLVADRKQVPAALVNERNLQFKRDSVLRMNMAVAVEPYRHDAVFTQSPLTVKNPAAPWQNATSSALLHRETSFSAFQYPLALNLNDCLPIEEDGASPVDGLRAIDDTPYANRGEQYRDWLRHVLRAVSELSDVAGNHARSLFVMAPSSIVIRMTERLVPDFDLYGFQPDGSFPEVVDGILNGDYPGNEFLFGGAIVKTVLSAEQQQALAQRGVSLHRMPAAALSAAAERATGQGFLKPSPASPAEEAR
jgi:CRISPR-associated protein Cst2